MLALCAVIAARAPLGIDYGPVLGEADNARPQIDALARLHVHDFFAQQSPLGPVSLVARAPFAAVASADDELARYRLGAFPCLLTLGLAALALAAATRRRGSPWWHAGLVVGVVMLTPPVDQALMWGHPEEMLTTGLLIVAALLASASMAIAAGVVLGLAVATKAWALVAALPIVFLAAQRARRVAVPAAITALVLIAPLALANTSAFRRAAHRANTTAAVKPMDVWWLTSTRRVSVDAAGQQRSVRRPKLPHLVNRWMHTAILLIAAAIALAARRRLTSLPNVLLALALILLLRCLLDPGDQTYYHVGFIAALAGWEGTSRRPPLLALGASVLLSSRALRTVDSDPDQINVLYLAWSVPLAAFLALRLRRA